MATLNDKLYAIGGNGTNSIEFLDANKESAGWQNYSQASFAVQRYFSAISCAAIRTGTYFLSASASAHDLISTDGCASPFTMTSFTQTLSKKAI